MAYANCFTAEGRVFKYKHLRGGQKYSTILKCIKVPRLYMALDKESNDSALLDQRLLPADAQCLAPPLHSPFIPDCKGPALVGEAPGRYHNTESWEMTVPADLIAAVEHLRRSFEDAHWGFRGTTQKYCFAELHGLVIDDPAKEYLNYLMYMKVRFGAAATQRFHDLIKRGTSPAIFKAFFDLYIDGVTVQALLIFEELKEVGRANHKQLAANYLDWAEAQTKHLIRSNFHLIPM